MTTATRKRARKQPAEVRREEILDAAVRVFARTSYGSAGTAEIAREAGIAEPTIYRHFGSKRELYLAALERCGGMVQEMFRDIAGREPDALRALHRMGDWYGQNIALNPEPLRMRQRAIAEAEEDEVRGLLQRVYGDIIAIVTEVMERGQAQGTFTSAISADGLAWSFVAIGQLMDAALLMGITAGECEERFEELMIAHLRGLLADPGRARDLHQGLHDPAVFPAQLRPNPGRARDLHQVLHE